MSNVLNPPCVSGECTWQGRREDDDSQVIVCQKTQALLVAAGGVGAVEAAEGCSQSAARTVQRLDNEGDEVAAAVMARYAANFGGQNNAA